ncbi:ribonuclease P protein subunit p29-like [Styela clava]|uniref:ribonuclease P protein subunit p29-like n=1 Tax=Styela clava TaxID=7725 RepID=UPI001939F2DC|nr:ribonuclease P protein subunit p29-like [Styela clava]
MSRQGTYSYVEAFIQKTIPKIKERDLKTLKSSLRNKPIMLVGEQKRAKKRKREKQNKRRIKNRILAKPTNSNYQDYEKLRILWMEYITDLLSDYQTLKPGETKPSLDNKNAQEVLLKADYHGADLSVTGSPCKSHLGLSGTVLQETKNIFLICTKENKLVRIPKNKTIFTLEYSGYLITIFGSQFCFKPSHRLMKRFTKNPRLKELLR